jgi:hypothetical protein
MAPKNEGPEKPKGPICTACGGAIQYPDFSCDGQPGNHQLPLKTYYHLGGAHIQDRRDRRRFSPTLILKPAREYFNRTSQETTAEPQLLAVFSDGKYSTRDAQIQYLLDRHSEVVHGDEGLAQWRKIYLTDEQQTLVMKNEVAELDREIAERKALLDKVKAQAS